MGKTHRPFYRLRAMDARDQRDGRAIEELGFYDPLTKDESRRLKLNKERIEYWLSVGAQPSDTARGLFRQIGIDIEPVKRPTRPSRAEREAAEAAAKAEAEAAEKAKAEAEAKAKEEAEAAEKAKAEAEAEGGEERAEG
jgi:small subunit ribosomal protein S16